MWSPHLTEMPRPKTRVTVLVCACAHVPSCNAFFSRCPDPGGNLNPTPLQLCRLLLQHQLQCQGEGAEMEPRHRPLQAAVLTALNLSGRPHLYGTQPPTGLQPSFVALLTLGSQRCHGVDRSSLHLRNARDPVEPLAHSCFLASSWRSPARCSLPPPEAIEKLKL
ncbi:uncharacterized protein [Oryctolagus cuniculus]|uniref:uncharacterized protein isoform X2 n=1 Tax=Oryctolagus cuniculus TaxID=9986 RepID=UPI003879566D